MAHGSGVLGEVFQASLQPRPSILRRRQHGQIDELIAAGRFGGHRPPRRRPLERQRLPRSKKDLPVISPLVRPLPARRIRE